MLPFILNFNNLIRRPSIHIKSKALLKSRKIAMVAFPEFSEDCASVNSLIALSRQDLSRFILQKPD